MFFRLKKGAGNHTQVGKDGKIITYTFEEGGLIKSEIDLSEKFLNKFERVDVPGSASIQNINTPENKKSNIQKAAEKSVKDIMPDLNEDEEEEKKEPLGKDVTKNYKRALEEDLKVFYKRYKGRFVAEAEDSYIALNKKPLKKDEVIPFIEKWLKG